jgi:hypothetical protein
VFLTIGQLLTAALPAAVVYLVLTSGSYADPESSSAVANPFVPATIVLFFGYVVGGVFSTVYDTMSDAILMSFCYNESNHIFEEGADDPAADIKAISMELDNAEASKGAQAAAKPAGTSGEGPSVAPVIETGQE